MSTGQNPIKTLATLTLVCAAAMLAACGQEQAAAPPAETAQSKAAAPVPETDPIADAAEVMTEASYRRHVETLASDEFGGRAPASPGEDLTIAYLVDHFKGLGLEPANNGSYTQDVPLAWVEVVNQPDLVFSGGEGEDMVQPANIRSRASAASCSRLDDNIIAGFIGAFLSRILVSLVTGRRTYFNWNIGSFVVADLGSARASCRLRRSKR